MPFRTKPRIAAELIRDVAVLGQVELDWVVADEEYGRAGHFLDELETPGAAVRARGAGDDGGSGRPTRRAASRPTRGGAASRRPRTRDAVRTVAEIADELPASAWTALQVREGATGPLVLRVRGGAGLGRCGTASRGRRPGC